MKRISVFCGSSPGARPEYVLAARQLAKALVSRSIGLVYGGASVGLMGELARTVEAFGGEVVGVIPKSLVDKEIAYRQLKDLRVVGSMHERKALIADLVDRFIAIPGGLGTLEEFFEVLTWAQLGIHRKPCGLLNVVRYYDGLLEFLDHAVEQRFVKDVHRALIIVNDDPNGLVESLLSYRPVTVDKWLDREAG
jgi:uncharacterized protein (TIGR00730 family)